MTGHRSDRPLESARTRDRRFSVTGRRRDGTNPRTLGTNPRALLTNPRALGTNGSAGEPSSAGQLFRMVNRAYARIHEAGDVWCERCDDIGHIDVSGRNCLMPCPDHRSLTYRDAIQICAGHISLAHQRKATK